MAKPLLQVALDNLKLGEGLRSAAKLRDYVDIIEVGTLFCLSEGAQTIEAVRGIAPESTIAADLKIMDAGDVLTKMAIDAGANWVTISCAATVETMIKAQKQAESQGGEMQIELFQGWTMETAQEWQQTGIKQAIYHRSRDSQAAGKGWGKEDLSTLEKLAVMGYELSVTGGISVEEVKVFKDIPVKCFICGRNLREAESPQKITEEFREEFDKYWN